METKFRHLLNGQEIEQDDINLIATDAALADDRVFAELFRMTPFDGVNITKGIVSYSQGPTVLPSTGKVLVYPFRALIGSRVEESDDALDNWREIRSGIFMGSDTAFAEEVSFSSNPGIYSRWDLVYAKVIPDQLQTPVTRYVKTSGDPGMVVPTAISLYLYTFIDLLTVTGTASATPALPSLPTDTAEQFFIPLAYVRIVTGYTSATTIDPTDVFEVAPQIRIANVTGVSTARPYSTGFDKAGPVLSKSVGGVSDWGFTGSRPPTFMPPSMTGEEILYIALDVLDGSSSNWSQDDDTILDDSRDWRNRVFQWTVQGSNLSSDQYAWEQGTSAGEVIPAGYESVNYTALTPKITVGMGNSFQELVPASGKYSVAYLTDDNFAPVGSSDVIDIYVDPDTGYLKFKVTGTPGCKLFMRLCASPQFLNK